jgi:hypothetical protein
MGQAATKSPSAEPWSRPAAETGENPENNAQHAAASPEF